MPNTFDVTADDRRLRFADDLTVSEIADDASVSRTTSWETVSTDKTNEVSFQFDGETKTSLAVNYAFNDRNQLTLQVIKQSGVLQPTDPFTLQGKIFVDDVNDVEYALFDDTGKLTDKKIFVYSTISLSDDHTKLQVVFSDGVETDITGIGDKTENLSTEEYSAGGDLASDLLSFQAATINTIGGKDRMANAEIKFYGRWDLHEKSLVFVTGYDSSTGTPQAYVSISGNIAATNVGLVVKQDGDTVLQIDGKYAWNKSTLGWDLAVGYSKSAGLEARLNADAAFVGKKGKLTLKGGATLKKGTQGTDLNFDLALAYTAENRNLVFTLTGGNGSYEIKFSGNVKIAGASVTFEITAANKNGQTSVQGKVEFGAFNKNSNLKLALEATLGKNGLQLKADMSFSFSWGPNGPVATLS